MYICLYIKNTAQKYVGSSNLLRRRLDYYFKGEQAKPATYLFKVKEPPLHLPMPVFNRPAFQMPPLLLPMPDKWMEQRGNGVSLGEMEGATGKWENFTFS